MWYFGWRRSHTCFHHFPSVLYDVSYPNTKKTCILTPFQSRSFLNMRRSRQPVLNGSEPVKPSSRSTIHSTSQHFTAFFHDLPPSWMRFSSCLCHRAASTGSSGIASCGSSLVFYPFASTFPRRWGEGSGWQRVSQAEEEQVFWSDGRGQDMTGNDRSDSSDRKT